MTAARRIARPRLIHAACGGGAVVVGAGAASEYTSRCESKVFQGNISGVSAPILPRLRKSEDVR